MLKALKNKRGSAIVWALLVLAMLSVLIATALTISFNYAQRSRSGVDAQQCYFSARSVAEAVAQDIVDAKTPSLLPESASDEYPVSAQYDAVLPDQMGVCTVSVVHKSKNAASVTATAKRGLSSYSYTIDLAADSVVVPFFEGGLYVYALGENSPIQSVNRDLYIAGSGASVIDFPVTGNVFAPYSNVKITGSGGVAGTIIANSINYEGDVTTDRFMPIAAVSNGAGSQSASLDNDITEQRMLTAADYNRILSFKKLDNNGVEKAFLVINPTKLPDEEDLENYKELSANFEFESGSLYKVSEKPGETYLITVGNRSGNMSIAVLQTCTIGSFYRRSPASFPVDFLICDSALTLNYFLLTSYNNCSFGGLDNSALVINRNVDFTMTGTTYLGQISGPGHVEVRIPDSVPQQTVEILSLGWKITGSEEGAECTE